MTRHAVGYLRRSSVAADSPGDVSEETQASSVHRLAAQYDEDDGLELFKDWGRSGRQDGTIRRPEYRRMLERIKADEVSTVYAYSLSRLSRGVRDLQDLLALARLHDVNIRLVKEGSLEGGATGNLYAGLLGLFAEFELEVAAERARDAIATRREAGLRMGPPPYGYRIDGDRFVPDEEEWPYVEEVLEAYRRTQAYQGAARELNRLGVPTRRGGLWGATTVRQIVKREAPGMVNENVARGRPGLGGFRLAGLLRCPCGAMLTGRRYRRVRLDGREVVYVGYTCRQSATDPDHPRPFALSEARAMRFVRRALRGMRIAPDAEAKARARVEAAEEGLGRLLPLATSGLITAEEFAEERTRLKRVADEAKRSMVRYLHVAVDVDANAPADVNRDLRAIFERFELEPGFERARAVFSLAFVEGVVEPPAPEVPA